MRRKNPDYNSLGQFTNFGSKECLNHSFNPFYTQNGLLLKDEFNIKDLMKEGECCIRCTVCGIEKDYIKHNHAYKEAGMLVQNPGQISPKTDYTLNFDFLGLTIEKSKPKICKVALKGDNLKGFPCGIHSRICGNGCAYREWWDTKAFNKKAKVLQEICPSKRVRKKFVPKRFYKKIRGKYESVSNHYKGTIYVKKDGVFWRWNKKPKKQLNYLKSFSRNKKESLIEEDFIKILKIK
tara:strand:- start:4373 stop:5083 length:711 start_codon:yes stop_codon:yes gene_type:complete